MLFAGRIETIAKQNYSCNKITLLTGGLDMCFAHSTTELGKNET